MLRSKTLKLGSLVERFDYYRHQDAIGYKGSVMSRLIWVSSSRVTGILEHSTGVFEAIRLDAIHAEGSRLSELLGRARTEDFFDVRVGDYVNVVVPWFRSKYREDELLYVAEVVKVNKTADNIENYRITTQHNTGTTPVNKTDIRPLPYHKLLRKFDVPNRRPCP